MDTLISWFSARFKGAVVPVWMFTFLAPVAHAQGLSKATSFLENIRDQLTLWIPIIAVIAGLVLVIAYWFNMIQKDTFIRWLVGLIIAGSILEIVALFV